jgi:hypothetical protein
MNRLTLSALGLAGVLAFVAEPAAAQHRRGGEERGGNGEARGQNQQQSQPRQQSQPSQQAESGQRVPGWRQPSQPAQAPPPRQQSQPAQAPPSPPNVAPGAVPRQGFERAVPQQGVERAVPRQGFERTVPRQDVERAVPRQDFERGRQGFNGRYDNRRYGYAAPRYVGPRYYSGYYNGPRYVGPRFTVAPRRFYRPYYAFRPRISIGFGIWAGYPVTYYDPYYYPYDYYPYYTTPGYLPPAITVQPDQSNMGGLSFSISPDTAEVWVDGNYFGAVGDYGPESQPLGLPAGRHHVELREPGYQVSSFDVDIVPGQVIPYQGQLEP